MTCSCSLQSLSLPLWGLTRSAIICDTGVTVASSWWLQHFIMSCTHWLVHVLWFFVRLWPPCCCLLYSHITPPTPPAILWVPLWDFSHIDSMVDHNFKGSGPVFPAHDPLKAVVGPVRVHSRAPDADILDHCAVLGSTFYLESPLVPSGVAASSVLFRQVFSPDVRIFKQRFFYDSWLWTLGMQGYFYPIYFRICL